MWEAALNEIPIVLFPIMGGGWTLDDARTLLSDLMGQMQSRNPSCMAEVMTHVHCKVTLIVTLIVTPVVWCNALHSLL